MVRICHVVLRAAISMSAICVGFAVAANGSGTDLVNESQENASKGSNLPRYRLKVGQELVYEQTSEEDLLTRTEEQKKDRNVYETKYKWWVWVTKKVEAGGWRLLLRKRIDNFVTHPGKARELQFENDVLGYCDLFDDGRFTRNRTIEGHPFFVTLPGELFIQLPPNAKGVSNGWSYASSNVDETQTFKVIERNGDVLRLSGVAAQPRDKNYQQLNTRQIDFDLKLGVVVKIVNESKADWKINPWHVRNTIELHSIKDRSTAEIEKLASEGDCFLAAQQESNQLFHEALYTHTKAECEKKMANARQVLAECKASLVLPEMQSICDLGLKRFDSDAKAEINSAAKREKLYDKPAIDWKTTDLDGKPQTLVNYRGKIVLLDFWYRGCGHCIEALPKVKQLVTRYRGKNVVILGVNNDDDVSDAQFVIKTFDLKYKNIHAGDLPELYEVNAWPTFIVLDQTGRIADYHEGNSEDLYEHISGVVDQYLEHPATDVN